MKTLILAAGYATRLYPLTLDTPKPLLKLKDKPILDYIIDKIETVEDIAKVYLVTNHKFYGQFEDWINSQNNGYPSWIKLINDGSRCLEDRRGAIGDIELAIRTENIDDDLLVIAGDNLFDFDLSQFINFSKTRAPYHSICLYLANNGLDLTRFGIAQLNGDYELANFEEKPDFPKSNLIATCIYFFPKEKLHLISDYLNQGHHNDTPGSYIRWLTQNDKVFGKICDGMWYDLGDFSSLTEASIHLSGNRNKVAELESNNLY